MRIRVSCECYRQHRTLAESLWLFKAKHPGNEGEEMGNHPMQFYQESVRFYLAKEKPVRGERAERARSYPASSQLQRTVSTVLAGQARLYRWRKLCFQIGTF